MLFAFSARATFRRRRTVKFWLHFIPCGIDTFCRGKRLAKRSFKTSQKRFYKQKFISRFFDIKFAQTERRSDQCEKRKRKRVDEPPSNGSGDKFKRKSVRTAEIDPTSAGRDLQGYFIDTEIGRI